jgi:hypothetical protein
MPKHRWMMSKGPGRAARMASAGLATTLLTFTLPALAQDAGQSGAAASATRQEAIEVVRGMATYVGGQQNIALAFESELQVATPEPGRQQYNVSGTAKITRPDKFRVSRTSGDADVELVYDGQTVTVYDRKGNRYAREPMNGPIGDVVDRMRNAFRIDVPAADLMIAGSFDALMADGVEANWIGPAVIDGITCEHLALSNSDTDWQLWVEAGAQPAPCKMIIASKTAAGAPQYTIRFTDWHAGDGFPAGTFVFTPPAGAGEVAFTDLSDIGRLPPNGALIPGAAAVSGTGGNK